MDSVYAGLYSSYMTVIGVHEMHGWMPRTPITNAPHGPVTIMFAVSLLSQLAYLTISHTHPVAHNKLPKIVARQQQTNMYMRMHSSTSMY